MLHSSANVRFERSRMNRVCGSDCFNRQIGYDLEMDVMFDEGYELCFGGVNEDPAQGRVLLRIVGEGGRPDAYYYLGLSYELEELFDEADKAYLAAKREDGTHYTLAAYRSATLHKKQRVSKPDKGYYLRVFQQLATDSHWPSVGHHMRERLKGSYGVFEFFHGLLSTLPIFFRMFRAAQSDPDQQTISMRRS